VVNEPPRLSALGGGCLQTERPFGANRSPKGRAYLHAGTDSPLRYMTAFRRLTSPPPLQNSKGGVETPQGDPRPLNTVKPKRSACRLSSPVASLVVESTPIRNSAAAKCSGETSILLSPLFSDRGPQWPGNCVKLAAIPGVWFFLPDTCSPRA